MNYPFRELWCVDFEYQQTDASEVLPWPLCMVARDLLSGREVWRDELLARSRAPFNTGPGSALVAYSAPAELGCFLALGWPLPSNVIDLYVEHRVETNGKKFPPSLIEGASKDRRKKNSLLIALALRGLAHIDAGEKAAMIQLILRPSRQWSDAERRSIIDYCESDVVALEALLPVMSTKIDWPRALLRGRYMAAVARMERTGIPIDVEIYTELAERWDEIKLWMIGEVNKDFDVYEGKTLKQAKLRAYAEANNIAWAHTPTGLLSTDGDTLKELALKYPELAPFYELTRTLAQLKLSDIVVSADGRSHCKLFPFASKTGRNQPSNSKFIFGPARWMRGLIREREGRALAYVDWSNQEMAIAAGLSGDERMIEAYQSGDPYMEFAKAAGLAPPGATKEGYEDLRQICKAIVLGTGYGMGHKTMALKTGLSEIETREFLRQHNITYKKFWQHIDDEVTSALFNGRIQSVFGWQLSVGQEQSDRTLLNFPAQANGAEMMRVAAIAATEAGIEVCAPVHDAFLISAPIDRIDEDAAAMREIMGKAGRAVTGGLDVRTDVEIVRWPDRYMDPRGAAMWTKVTGYLRGKNELLGSEPTLTPETVFHMVRR